MSPNAENATASLGESGTCWTKSEPKHTYESGATRSERAGKGRFDLIPAEGLRRLAIRYEEGAAIHGDRNWENGFPISRCVDSAYRHLTQYNAGDRSEDHIAAVLWQCAAICFFEAEVKAGRLPPEIIDVKEKV